MVSSKANVEGGARTCAEAAAAKCFGLEEKDVGGVSLVSAAGFFLMFSYYLIQPLSDQLALHVGVEWTPLITVFRLILIGVCNPLYSALVKGAPVESVIPLLYRFLMLSLLLFVGAFLAFPTGEADKIVSFSFSVWTGTFSLFMVAAATQTPLPRGWCDWSHQLLATACYMSPAASYHLPPAAS